MHPRTQSGSVPARRQARECSEPCRAQDPRLEALRRSSTAERNANDENERTTAPRHPGTSRRRNPEQTGRGGHRGPWRAWGVREARLEGRRWRSGHSVEGRGAGGDDGGEEPPGTFWKLGIVCILTSLLDTRMGTYAFTKLYT